MRKIINLLLLFTNSIVLAQVPFTHISNSSFNAERVASFGVVDVSSDFLEITNSTQLDNSFIPSIWAHQESDNRFVLRHFVTTNSIRDNGTIPMMIFRTEIRNNLNNNAPFGGSFPWGTSSSNVITRPLFAWENGNTQLMRILANGNVGVGTINPTALFHTKGTLRFQNLTDATSPFKVLGTDNTGNVFEYSPSEITGAASNDYDWLKTDGAFPTSIDDNVYTNGNVGINVINPTANLNTNGTLKFENLTDAISPFKVLGTDNTGNVFEYNPSEITGTASNDYDWLKTDGAFPTSIDDNIYTNGKIAINTNVFPNQVGDVDVSSYSLFAKGGILTEEVRVALNSEWADFVFDKEYKLESLKKVEIFILENKHLKDVPSAKEVEKNGVELGEMNKILLLKIEELTLYLIEINKKIDKQNEEIKKMNKK